MAEIHETEGLLVTIRVQLQKYLKGFSPQGAEPCDY
jgi:hypothetical protein